MFQILLLSLFSLTTLSSYGAPLPESFKFRGEWISPKIIQEFLPPSSDPAVPTVIAIDLGAATGTNRFFGKVAVKDGRVSVSGADDSSVVYEWKGRSKNGKHLLLIRETSGGTMVPTHLALFKIKNDKGVNTEGKPYQRVLLELDRLIGLGDRAFAEISLKKNRAIVKVSCEKTCESREFTLDL